MHLTNSSGILSESGVERGSWVFDGRGDNPGHGGRISQLQDTEGEFLMSEVPLYTLDCDPEHFS